MNRMVSLYQALSSPAKRAFWIVASIGALLILLSITLVHSLLTAPSLQDLFAVSTPYTLAFIAVISAISILYNRVQFGAWLFFISTVISMLALQFIQQGFAFPSAVLVLVVTILIPLQVATGRSAAFATVSGFVVAGGIFAIDTFWAGKRAGINLTDLQNVRYITIALGVILFISIFALYRTFFLRTKLLLLTLGASLLSIIAVSGVNGFYVEAALTQSARENLLTAAEHTADTIDAYLGFNVELLQAEAALPVFSQHLSGQNKLNEVQQTILNLAERDPENIGSIALLDKNGVTIWDSFTADVGGDQSEQDYFTLPFSFGIPYISPVRFSPTSSDHGFYISAPVRDPDTGAILGILRIRIRTEFLESIVEDNQGAAGPGSYAILLDEYNIVLADSAHPDHLGRPVKGLPQQQVTFLKTENRLANLPDDQISLGMAEFAIGLENLGTTPYFSSADSAFGEPVLGASKYLSRQPWKVSFIQSQAIALAPAQQQTRINTTVALATGFLLGLATLFISRTITDPVARLTKAAEEISAGNLNVRAQIVSQDELGALATTINDMSDQLRQTLAGLETTIAERTLDLEKRGEELALRSHELETANQRAERRASQLFAVSVVSNAIANVQNLDDIFPLITQTISQQFGFYHVGIFLNDANNQFAVLRAANSEGGQRMLLRGHRLKIGETGIVGNVASTGRARIALDTGEDAIFFNNPDLPDTRSEMALPLRSGTVVIGVLDVQSLEPNAFSSEDVEILGVLAGQVSTAIRNAQLFEEIQRTAAELQQLLQQDSREQWQRVIKSQNRTGYYYDGSAVKFLEKPAEKDHDVVLIPINVRGQSIGKLGIRVPNGSTLKPDELDVIRAVSERLAISAENARLLEDSQIRANKERTIGHISDRIGASTNIDNVFRALMEELGQVLPGSEIIVQFKEEK